MRFKEFKKDIEKSFRKWFRRKDWYEVSDYDGFEEAVSKAFESGWRSGYKKGFYDSDSGWREPN